MKKYFFIAVMAALMLIAFNRSVQAQCYDLSKGGNYPCPQSTVTVNQQQRVRINPPIRREVLRTSSVLEWRSSETPVNRQNGRRNDNCISCGDVYSNRRPDPSYESERNNRDRRASSSERHREKHKTREVNIELDSLRDVNIHIFVRNESSSVNRSRRSRVRDTAVRRQSRARQAAPVPNRSGQCPARCY